MAVAKLDIIEQYFSNAGLVGNGYKIHTYAGGTSTPLAAYTSSTGGTAHANPIILDSAGRPPGDGIWLTVGTAYKITISTAADVVLETVDNVTVSSGSAAAVTTRIPLAFLYHGTNPPGTSEWLGGFSFDTYTAATFPANWSGAQGHINTNPTSSFVITLRKNATTSANGTAVGTVTVSPGGAFTFATTAGASQAFVAGDHLSAWGPGTADATANDFNFTMTGTVS